MNSSTGRLRAQREIVSIEFYELGTGDAILIEFSFKSSAPQEA
jgi:hypothetical protein